MKFGDKIKNLRTEKAVTASSGRTDRSIYQNHTEL